MKREETEEEEKKEKKEKEEGEKKEKKEKEKEKGEKKKKKKGRLQVDFLHYEPHSSQSQSQSWISWAVAKAFASLLGLLGCGKGQSLDKS